jgi:hypothetical protein
MSSLTFQEIKENVINNYKTYLESNCDDSLEIDEDEYISEAKNINELINILDELGFNGTEAYDFIFESIID